MKTLEEIKGEVAQEHGYHDWKDFLLDCSEEVFTEGPEFPEKIINEVIELYAEEKARHSRRGV